MLFEYTEVHYLQLVSSFRHEPPFLSAELLPAAAWPGEISARPGCSLCQCFVYPVLRNKQHTKSPQLWKYSAITPAITAHLHGKYTVDPHEYTAELKSIFIQTQMAAETAQMWNNTKTSWRKSKPTLYSKHDTQIVRSSSSLLSCEGGISVVQRWIRLLSAFFITHKKHTSRFRLVSAGRVATVLPCWEEQGHVKIGCGSWSSKPNCLHSQQTHI